MGATIIRPENVRSIVIDEKCMLTMPCLHKVTITLNDGRSIREMIDGITIQTLAESIPKDKVTGEWCIYNKNKILKPRTPTSILSSLFRQK